MIKIIINNYFFEEKSYIVNVICSFLNIKYKLEVDNDIINYEILIGKKKIICKDDFFHGIKDKNYLLKKYLPKQPLCSITNQFTFFDNLPIIYGCSDVKVTDNEIYCGIDIFASCYFMLTRWEECVKEERDDYNRFLAVNSLAYQENFLSRPIVNEYIEFLWNMISFLNSDIKREKNKYELFVSHDIDEIEFYNTKRHLFRVMLGDIIKRKKIKLVFYHFCEYVLSKKNVKYDPFFNFSKIMDLSDLYGVKSRFYFLNGGTSKYDSRYKMDKLLKENIFKLILARNHIIGSHYSYSSQNNIHQLKKEITSLQEMSKKKITEGRSHYLVLDIPATFIHLEKAGIQIDSTGGYADKEGFRFGTGNEFYIFDFFTAKQLGIKQRPLIFMDTRDTNCGGHIINQEEDNDIFHIIKLSKKIQTKNTILFHNAYIQESNKYYFEMYVKILECANNMENKE